MSGRVLGSAGSLAPWWLDGFANGASVCSYFPFFREGSCMHRKRARTTVDLIVGKLGQNPKLQMPAPTISASSIHSDKLWGELPTRRTPLSQVRYHEGRHYSVRELFILHATWQALIILSCCNHIGNYVATCLTMALTWMPCYKCQKQGKAMFALSTIVCLASSRLAVCMFS